MKGLHRVYHNHISARVLRCSPSVTPVLPPRHSSTTVTSATSQQQHLASSITTLLKDNNIRLTSLSHDLWRNVVQPGDICIDATAGKGIDTTLLASLVGPTGHIYAFDVQQEALETTKYAIKDNIDENFKPSIDYILGCHSEMTQRIAAVSSSSHGNDDDDISDIEGFVALVCFNLGYLPGIGDKNITTRCESTLKAIQAAQQLLKPGGMVSVLSYLGHEEGRREYEAVKRGMVELPTYEWITLQVQTLNRPSAPILMTAQKR
jgi:predicted methyltransferase